MTVCAALALGLLAVAMPSADAVPRGRCNHPVVVTTLEFGPSIVAPGGTSTVRLSGRNCSRSPQQVTVTWTASFTGDTTGCPVIDPLPPRTLTIARGQGLRDHQTYTVPAACAADTLKATARVTDKTGKRISTKSAALRIRHKHPTGGGGY